jgi:crotonobetainyl-CoA:carnitine CoA-transferase CaiB-like acyl-CoA transferase
MFRRRNARGWCRILVRGKVPATTVSRIRDVARDPQVLDRKMIMKSIHNLSDLGSPMRFYKTRPKRTTSAPQLGQHSKEILTDLGYSKQGIEKLRTDHVFE